MEEEIKAGIEKFKSECAALLPGVALVIPVRPTGANFLVSLTHEGQRTYVTIHEDDFADWGEASDSAAVKTAASTAIRKLKE